MKTSFILLFSILLVTCTKQQNSTRFTQEQIQSLQLDSTVVLSVNADSTIHVDLNPFLEERIYDLENMIEEIKLIPLETKGMSITEEGESLLGGIYNIIVSDSNIYVHDKFKGQGLVIFDREGKFIRRIPHGQGPGELIRFYDMAYDSQANELVIYVHSFLMYFTPKGEFIRQVRLPFGFYNFTVIPNGYVFKALEGQGGEHLGKYKDYSLLVTDKKFAIKSIGLPYNPETVSYSHYNYLFSNNHSLQITQHFVDTIYEYKNNVNELKAKYVLDYSDKKIPEYLVTSTNEDFFEATKSHNYYYHLGEYQETNHHQAFFLNNDYNRLNTIIYRDKKTGNLQGGTFGKYDDINEIPSMTLPIGTSGDYFVASHFPGEKKSSLFNSSMLTEEDKKKIENLTQDDNPVLVFYKLKSF